MSTIPGFNALMAQAYNNPTTDIENQLRRQQINAMQMQQQREQAQIPLIQAQTQGAQIQNQLAQQGLNDNSIWRGLYANHAQDNWTDPNIYQKMEKEYIQQGGSYQGLNSFRQQRLQNEQSWLTMDKERMALNENVIAQSGDIAQSLRDIQDPQRRLDALSVYGPRWAGIHNGKPLTANDITDDHLDYIIGATRSQEAQLKRKKELQDVATGAATERENTAKATHQELVNRLIQQGQAAQQAPSGPHPVDVIFPAQMDQQINASYKAAYDAAGRQPPDAEGRRPAQDAILTAAANHAAEFQKATSPIMQQAAANKAVKEGTAMIPVRAAQSAAETAGRLQTEAKLAPPGFQSIQEPGARARAEAAYAKDSQEYQDKVQAAQLLSNLIESVQSGNKAAAGQIPMAAVRGYTNRFNRQELEGVSSAAGNAMDRINAFVEHNFGKSGADISPDVLKDLQTVNSVMENAAYQSYQQKVDILNQANGLSGDRAVKPVQKLSVQHGATQESGTPQRPASIPRGARAQYNAATKQWRYSTDGGQTWQIVKGG